MVKKQQQDGIQKGKKAVVDKSNKSKTLPK